MGMDWHKRDELQTILPSRHCCDEDKPSLNLGPIVVRRTLVSTKYPQLARIIAEKSLKRGKFTLASGRTSDYYIDARLSSLDPAGASAIADCSSCGVE